MTNVMMTEEELQAARALCDAATTGPWKADLDIFDADEGIVAAITDTDISLLATIGTDLKTDGDHAYRERAWQMAKDGQELRDARLMAESRTLIPQLLDEVGRLRTHEASLTTANEHLHTRLDALIEERADTLMAQRKVMVSEAITMVAVRRALDAALGEVRRQGGPDYLLSEARSEGLAAARTLLGDAPPTSTDPEGIT